MNEERCSVGCLSRQIMYTFFAALHSITPVKLDGCCRLGWIFFTKILLRSRVEFSRIVGMIFRFLGLRMIFYFLVFKKRKTRSSLFSIHAQRRNECSKRNNNNLLCILASIRILRIPTYATAENSSVFFYFRGRPPSVLLLFSVVVSLVPGRSSPASYRKWKWYFLLVW
jgi:hypothetical protein